MMSALLRLDNLKFLISHDIFVNLHAKYYGILQMKCAQQAKVDIQFTEGGVAAVQRYMSNHCEREYYQINLPMLRPSNCQRISYLFKNQFSDY